MTDVKTVSIRENRKNFHPFAEVVTNNPHSEKVVVIVFKDDSKLNVRTGTTTTNTALEMIPKILVHAKSFGEVKCWYWEGDCSVKYTTFSQLEVDSTEVGFNKIQKFTDTNTENLTDQENLNKGFFKSISNTLSNMFLYEEENESPIKPKDTRPIKLRVKSALKDFLYLND